MGVINILVSAVMYLGVYAIAATVLWIAAWSVSPVGTHVRYRRVALAVAFMFPLDFVIRYAADRFLGGSGGFLIGLGVDTAIVVMALGMPLWRSLLATFAYYAALLAIWVVVGLTFGPL
jgi:hypothetical protein